MSFISRLFSKSPSDLLAKGDKYMASDCFFDARTCYEDGLKLCPGADGADSLPAVFAERIDEANRKLAERNIAEAEFAHSRGDVAKAIDHLELAKTLTADQDLRKQADKLLLDYSQTKNSEPVMQPVASSCNSCAGSSCAEPESGSFSDDSLPLMEYYELLIHQLPADLYHRYAGLGEDFAQAYVAASRDEHQEALGAFEKCYAATPLDIYSYEKGKILHRLGNDLEAEQHLRKAVQLNSANSLAWLNLALMLREGNRFQDALDTIEAMVAGNILPGQALMLRADICEVTGDHESALNLYVQLLQTPHAREAAERLYVILMEVGRDNDAAVIFKKYLNKSCH